MARSGDEREPTHHLGDGHPVHFDNELDLYYLLDDSNTVVSAGYTEIEVMEDDEYDAETGAARYVGIISEPPKGTDTPATRCLVDTSGEEVTTIYRVIEHVGGTEYHAETVIDSFQLTRNDDGSFDEEEPQTMLSAGL